MTDAEFRYLDNDVSQPFEEFYDAGQKVRQKGWIDDFGLVTPQGREAMEHYRRFDV